MSKYNVGDTIQFKNSTVRRVITEVRRNGYSTVSEVHRGGGKIYEDRSEDFPDRLLTDGWHKV